MEADVSNATYLVPQIDYDYFNPENTGQMRPPRSEEEKTCFRRTILDIAARTGATIFPAHLAGHSAMTTSRAGTAQLKIDRWAQLLAI